MPPPYRRPGQVPYDNGSAESPLAFPIEDIRAAVELQAARHVRGKVVIDL
ncbi:hypothetical protein [Streptomyces sp. SDr-06]|nr:hypothetical protein [Streptomyces sp. SDr-06]